MARKNRRRKGGKSKKANPKSKPSLHPGIKTSVLGIIALGFAVIFVLASFAKAGPAGEAAFKILDRLLGWGYFSVPLVLTLIGMGLLTHPERAVVSSSLIGAIIFIGAGLSIIDILSPEKAGSAGVLFGNVENLLGYAGSLVFDFMILLASLLVVLNIPLTLKIKWPKREKVITPRAPEEKELVITPEAATASQTEEEAGIKEEPVGTTKPAVLPVLAPAGEAIIRTRHYTPPPLSLLKTSTEKPTAGDLRVNATTIKRTLESFGIPVEMGEITIGPKVTRYALKPAEGIKLSRIMALNQDLSLALAAHPIRIEAPIPGRSLVGIEIPNKVASLVRLGALVAYPEFKKTSNLGFPLGRDVSGEPIFVSLSRMPHLLIAGSTGSGKSIAIHSLIISLLYKNSPETLRLILIDPKRVELSVYEDIPHLLTPVITNGKKAIASLRFAIQEMENRYELLLKAGKRDILGYNLGRQKDFMPYLVIVIDELADLMAAFGREIEASVVRLAQMARATGIHLVVSTQRPSVEVITGLIKANITSRMALQVASQIDSRTILDTGGAEKLLGGGDMLFVSAELSKPKRIQGGYISEEEIKDVTNFIRAKNPVDEEEVELELQLSRGLEGAPGAHWEADFEEEIDDELYQDALRVVKEAKKASASLLQRRLKIGYARAARLLDIMEEQGLIGPGEGAKPREVFLKSEE